MRGEVAEGEVVQRRLDPRSQRHRGFDSAKAEIFAAAYFVSPIEAVASLTCFERMGLRPGVGDSLLGKTIQVHPVAALRGETEA